MRDFISNSVTGVYKKKKKRGENIYVTTFCRYKRGTLWNHPPRRY